MKTAAERKAEMLERYEVMENKNNLVLAIRDAQRQYNSFEELFAVYKTVGYTDIVDVHAITRAAERNMLNPNSFTIEELETILKALKKEDSNTNKTEKAEPKMEYIKCSEKELNAMDKFLQAAQELDNVVTNETNEVLKGEEIYLNDIKHSIGNNELFAAYKRFVIGLTKVYGYDAVNYTGVELIEVLHSNYDWVFGKYKEGEETIFFIAETKDSWNEDLEQDETIFQVEETPISLTFDCMKINTKYEYLQERK